MPVLFCVIKKKRTKHFLRFIPVFIFPGMKFKRKMEENMRAYKAGEKKKTLSITRMNKV